MIISRTPYRISFAGGLSDLESYYSQRIGQVISTTIDKYIYITISKSPTNRYRTIYKQIEEVTDINKIQHPLIRECLKYVGIDEPIEIVSLADTVGGGGLGSSSSYTVGLLNALYRYMGIRTTKCKLAEDACKIEIDILKEPIGKQDQYAAAFGGLNKICFYKDRVGLNPINIDNNIYLKLQNNLLLFDTGITRKASSVLTNQKENMNNILDIVTNMTDISENIYEELTSNNLDNIGNLMKKEWDLKKLTGNVSNEYIDKLIDISLSSGALGSKICGAGSGGYLLVYCDIDKQDNVRKDLSDLTELKFNFEEEGSKIIYGL